MLFAVYGYRISVVQADSIGSVFWPDWPRQRANGFWI